MGKSLFILDWSNWSFYSNNLILGHCPIFSALFATFRSLFLNQIIILLLILNPNFANACLFSNNTMGTTFLWLTLLKNGMIWNQFILFKAFFRFFPIYYFFKLFQFFNCKLYFSIFVFKNKILQFLFKSCLIFVWKWYFIKRSDTRFIATWGTWSLTA